MTYLTVDHPSSSATVTGEGLVTSLENGLLFSYSTVRRYSTCRKLVGVRTD